MSKYFFISHPEDGRLLHPYPYETSKEYVWKLGIVGAAGFEQKEALIISKHCDPPGNIIPLGDCKHEKVK